MEASVTLLVCDGQAAVARSLRSPEALWSLCPGNAVGVLIGMEPLSTGFILNRKVLWLIISFNVSLKSQFGFTYTCCGLDRIWLLNACRCLISIA